MPLSKPSTAARDFSADRFFVVRAPSLPFDTIEAWSSGLAAIKAEAESLPDALKQDRVAMVDHLRAMLKRPGVLAAILLAAPEMEQRLLAWMEGELPADKARKMESTLTRYLIRMASRPTPFGIFAGCSFGSWGDRSDLAIHGIADATCHVRLDMDFLSALIQALEQQPDIRDSLRYFPNTYLHRAAGRLRYAEYKLDQDRGREYRLVAVDADDHLIDLLEHAKSGARLADLTASLVEQGTESDEAVAYVHELVESQILVSELSPGVTGADPLKTLVERLEAVSPLEHAAQLIAIQATLDAMNREHVLDVFEKDDTYRRMMRDMRSLPSAKPAKHLLQVDMNGIAPGAMLGPQVRQAIEEACELIGAVGVTELRDPLKQFKIEFQRRYETRWVPLQEALDEESGIGEHLYGHELDWPKLLHGLPFSAPEKAPSDALTKRSKCLLKKLLSLDGAQEWVLDDTDIEMLRPNKPRAIPDSFAAMAKLAATTPAALENGDFDLYLSHYYGPSGSRLLGRFCHLDENLLRSVKEHLAIEESLRPDAIFAEIVHLPEGRLGNILYRPHLRTHEIPFGANSTLPPECQLQLNDLLMTVTNDRVVLKSISLGKEVIPRLSSAHAYAQGIGLYRFLGYVQDQSPTGAGWTWEALQDLPFLPRVRRGRHVLARATWRLEQEELAPLLNAKGDTEAIFREVQALRRRRRLPRWIVHAEYDRELAVDLDNILLVEAWIDGITEAAAVSVMELFPAPDAMMPNTKGQRFTHELVVPFLQHAKPRSFKPTLPLLQSEERTYLPGSECLYAKIYMGTATSDRFLSKVLSPFLKETAGLWDNWFFIRYTDPDDHVRLRFFGKPEVLTGKMLPRLHGLLADYVKEGWCSKVMLDSYEPELDRYGGPRGVKLAEKLFWIDSECVLEILEAYPGNAGDSMRWKLALAGAHLLLTGLHPDPDRRLDIVGKGCRYFGEEFNAKAPMEIALGKKFREQRVILEKLLYGQAPEHFEAGMQALRKRTSRLLEWRVAMEHALAAGEVHRPLEELTGSYIHMHINRMLRSAQREQELVIYGFLSRIYASRAARLVSDQETTIQASRHVLRTIA